MSKLTEILGLFCYDPETDGANTFNIPKALNENWEKIDQLVLLAVAAAAAYDPEGSYAVGDYCTHGGKLHKCNTPIPDGEAWNAAHWTETTVIKEMEAVRADLANKLDTPTSLNANVDLNDVKTPGFYYCDGATGANRPINTGAFSLLVENTGSYGGNGRKQTFTDYSSGVTCTRTISGYSGEAWQGWKPLATATPPQVRNLTLQSGLAADGGCVYWITQNNIVTIVGGVYYQTGSFVADQDVQIGTLIAGFYPAQNTRCSATTASGSAYIISTEQTTIS